MVRQNRVPVQESVFSNLWVTIFPRFINRPWCDIPGIMYYVTYFCVRYYGNKGYLLLVLLCVGTCDTCYEIDTLRRSCPDAETQEQLKRAHHLHRGGLFNLERLRYKARCAEAIASNNLLHPTVMSLILDGMDQNHCRVPYLGGLNRFSHPITQHITGIISNILSIFVSVRFWLLIYK